MMTFHLVITPASVYECEPGRISAVLKSWSVKKTLIMTGDGFEVYKYEKPRSVSMVSYETIIHTALLAVQAAGLRPATARAHHNQRTPRGRKVSKFQLPLFNEETED